MSSIVARHTRSHQASIGMNEMLVLAVWMGLYSLINQEWSSLHFNIKPISSAQWETHAAWVNLDSVTFELNSFKQREWNIFLLSFVKNAQTCFCSPERHRQKLRFRKAMLWSVHVFSAGGDFHHCCCCYFFFFISGELYARLALSEFLEACRQQHRACASSCACDSQAFQLIMSWCACGPSCRGQ